MTSCYRPQPVSRCGVHGRHAGQRHRQKCSGRDLSSVPQGFGRRSHKRCAHFLIPPGIPTRVNSPSDVAFGERVSGTNLQFIATPLQNSFTVANSIVNGISVGAGGEGAVTGQEVRFSVIFLPRLICRRITTFLSLKLNCRMEIFCGFPLPAQLSGWVHLFPRVSRTSRVGFEMTQESLRTGCGWVKMSLAACLSPLSTRLSKYLVMLSPSRLPGS